MIVRLDLKVERITHYWHKFPEQSTLIAVCQDSGCGVLAPGWHA
jgi:hypothetical protein